MRLLNFTIIKLTFCLIIGIILGYFNVIDPSLILMSILILLLVIILMLLVIRKRLTKSVPFGFLSFLIFILIGASTVTIHNQKNFNNHYTKSINELEDSSFNIIFRVGEILRPSNKYSKYIIDILEVDGLKTQGRSLLNVKIDSIPLKLDVDQTFIFKSSFKNISPPLNPNQFDYKSYLERRYIYHQNFIENKQLYKLESKRSSIKGLANEIRSHINSKLNRYDFQPNELAIINALLLGQRRDLSDTVYKNYVNAGAVHILAVSGLHVGIILIILNFLFKPIEYYKYGRPFKTVIILLFLWGFALIAGLSPSVTRAVTMFSVIAIATGLKRPTNIYNTLAISAFIILLFKPLFLFDVGFQLSYAAVISIVAIDPILYKLWRPKNKILNIYWHTFTVTIAAQIGILPISLYYFHQFPALFFVSNLVIIPFLGIILGFGILVILLSSLNILPNFLASLFGSIIQLMNTIVEWVASKDKFIILDMYFNLFYVVAFYFFIAALFIWILKKNYRSIIFLFFSIILVQSAFVYTKLSSNKRQFIIFHKNKETLIAHRENDQLIFASNQDSLDSYGEDILKSYMVGSGISTSKQGELNAIYILNKTKLLLIDSLGIYNLKSFKPEYVLLSQSPKINLNRVIDSLRPKQIIADGSNYKSFIKYWKDICAKRRLPFHDTNKKGTLIIED